MGWYRGLPVVKGEKRKIAVINLTLRRLTAPRPWAGLEVLAPEGKRLVAVGQVSFRKLERTLDKRGRNKPFQYFAPCKLASPELVSINLRYGGVRGGTTRK